MKLYSLLFWGAVAYSVLDGIILPTSINIEHNSIPDGMTVSQSAPHTVQFIDDSIIRVYDNDTKYNRAIEEYKKLSKFKIEQILFLIEASEKRGLDPLLVLAVQAQESGWGSSQYCREYFNCFGYGALDSGETVPYYFDNDSYEEGTTKILDSFEKNYRFRTAHEMQQAGYNPRTEWTTNINKILNQLQ